ncbi:Phloem protein [Musa troglodytarum]|uniref:Phloem protein n=1 Tax=Musa troglodytarum TaxID=320322 RepID=A0A9E7EZP9_9LILI|nr:Phloem protein [Musa troglodytarum]
MSTSPHYKGVKNESTIKKDGDNLKINPTALDVTWGNDSRYWSIDKNAGPISLLQVSWLEVTGTFDLGSVTLDTSELYSLKFRVRMKADAFGWSGCPVYLMVKDAVNSKFKWKKVDLSRLPAGREVVIPEFFEEKHLFKPSPDKLIFGLFEIWRGRWKGGLEILEVIIEKT